MICFRVQGLGCRVLGLGCSCCFFKGPFSSAPAKASFRVLGLECRV